MSDGRGVPLAAQVTRGQQHESTVFEALMDQVKIGRRRRPRAVAGDKVYSVPRIRTWLRRHRIEAVISQRADEVRRRRGRPPRLDRERYRRRNAIERCVGWLKGCRRITTRHEKLAVHFLAMVTLAMIRQCLRLLDSRDTT